MPLSSPRLNAVATAAGRDPNRSRLFHWMVRNHKVLASKLGGPRINWTPLIESAVRAGALTSAGQPPTDLNMRRTWRKVCARIEAERPGVTAPLAGEPSQPKRKTYPRDMPKDFRPVPVSTALARSASADQPLPQSGSMRPLVADENGMLFGRKVTEGRYLPRPDVTGMSPADASNALQKWFSLKHR